MDWKIELIFVPVTDVDRAKEFYERIGFHADHDQVPYEGLRFVQMTPPGSACSIAFGTGLEIDLQPGQQNTIQVVVPDADQALADLTAAIAAQGRAQALDAARQAAIEAEGRERFRRFFGRD